MKKLIVASIASLAVTASCMAGVPGNCFGCHGQHGEKNTANPSRVPNKLTHDQIVEKLHAFKAGKEGTSMKMFAKPLTDAQIEDIAKAWGKK